MCYRRGMKRWGRRLFCGPPGMEEAVSGNKGYAGWRAMSGILGQLGYEKGMCIDFEENKDD